MLNYEKCFIQHMCCSDSLCSDCQEKIEHILISYKQKEQEIQELKEVKEEDNQTIIKYRKEIEKLQKENEEWKSNFNIPKSYSDDLERYRKAEQEKYKIQSERIFELETSLRQKDHEWKEKLKNKMKKLSNEVLGMDLAYKKLLKELNIKED